jgi:hypothetical protein
MAHHFLDGPLARRVSEVAPILRLPQGSDGVMVLVGQMVDDIHVIVGD